MQGYAKQFVKDHAGEILLSIPKTIWFNFKVLPFKKALRFPFVVSHYVRCRGVNRRTFVAEGDRLSTASLRIGFGDSAGARRESPKGLILIKNGGKIVLKGTVGLSQGVILIADAATVTLGKHFRCNYSTTIDCAHSDVTFGDEVVCGWRVTVKNFDGHTVIENGVPKPTSAPITVGNHVWLCAHSTVMKGVSIGDDSVVAYGSLLTKAQGEANVLFAGTPAKPIRDHITWEE